MELVEWLTAGSNLGSTLASTTETSSLSWVVRNGEFGWKKVSVGEVFESPLNSQLFRNDTKTKLTKTKIYYTTRACKYHYDIHISSLYELSGYRLLNNFVWRKLYWVTKTLFKSCFSWWIDAWISELYRDPASERQLNHYPASERQLNHYPTSERQLNHYPTSERQLSHYPASERQLSHYPASERQLNHSIRSKWRSEMKN